MIRSQIPLSLPPVPGSALGRGGRPAVVNGPAVRVHLGGGGVDYRSLPLQKPTPPFPLLPRRGGKLVPDRLCADVTVEIS